jgi:hypothetical protein
MKIPKNKALEQLHEEDIWSEEWEDYISTMAQGNWTDYDHQPWSWYMERDRRLHEGWQLITVGQQYKDVTVIYWLKSQNAKFKHSKHEFLIEDSQIAMMAALKFA